MYNGASLELLKVYVLHFHKRLLYIPPFDKIFVDTLTGITATARGILQLCPDRCNTMSLFNSWVHVAGAMEEMFLAQLQGNANSSRKVPARNKTQPSSLEPHDYQIKI